MELYTKVSLKTVMKGNEGHDFILPKPLFETHQYATIRLEAKLAYAAILDILMSKAQYTKENLAFIKVDNPEIKNTLARLANKEVNQEKMLKYIEELDQVNLIKVEGQNLFVYDLG